MLGAVGRLGLAVVVVVVAVSATAVATGRTTVPMWLIVLGVVLWRDLKVPSSRSEIPLVSVPSSV